MSVTPVGGIQRTTILIVLECYMHAMQSLDLAYSELETYEPSHLEAHLFLPEAGTGLMSVIGQHQCCARAISLWLSVAWQGPRTNCL